MNLEIEKIELKKGSHKNIEDGACIMELVSYLAGEPWSDHPECACPVLTSFAIPINDSMDDEYRQKLKPIIPKLLNSRDKNKQRIRAEFFAHQAITVFLPILTETLELVEISARLRDFKIGEWLDARDYILSIRQAIRDKATTVSPSTYASTTYASTSAATASTYASAASTSAATAYAAEAATAAAYAAEAATTATADSFATSAATAYAAEAATAAAYAAEAATTATADSFATAATAAAYADSFATAATATADSFATASAGSLWTNTKYKIWQSAIDALDKACEL